MSPIRKVRHLSESNRITKMKLRSAKQICFCKITNNAAKKLALYKLMKEKDFVDLTVCSKDGTRTNVHGMIFASLSDNIMEDISDENGGWQLDFTTDVLNILIQLVYHGTCNVTNDMVEALLQVANTYNIGLLKKLCGDFLLQNMSKESFLTYYSLSNDLCCHIKGEMNKFANKLCFAADVVLVSGGWSTDGPVNRIDIWDIHAEKWVLSNLVLPFGARAYHKMVCLGSNIYLVGGYEQNRIYHDTLYCLDLNTMAWTELSFMLTERCYVSATTLGNKLIVVRRYDGRLHLKSAEIYDPNTNQWKCLPNMGMRRSDAACFEFEDSIFAIGGFTGEDLLNEIEIWNPSTAQWRLSSPMTTPRSGHSAVVLDGRIYVVGRFDGEERLKSVECFTHCPIVMWYQVQDMLIPRSNFTISVVEGKILVCGGYSNPSVIGKCEMYFPKTNNWSVMSDLPVERSSLASVIVPEAPNFQFLLNKK